MEFLKRMLGYIEEKMLAITIIATFIISIIVFKTFWAHLITIIWVTPIMSKLYGYELLIAIVYGVIIAFYYYHKFKLTQYYNKNRACYFGLLFLIYILCFFAKEWKFSLITDKTYFSAWTNLIFLAIIPEIGLYLNCRKRKDITYYPQLEIEKTTETDDAYNRNGCCESVYKVIKTCFFENQSFAVGIAGSWGSGKTTYINALKRRFKESGEDISIIDFEPWKNDNPSLIIKSFFALLKSKLKPYISNISIPIDKYVSSLLDCDVPIKWKLFLNTIHFLSVAKKNSPYDQIYNCLSTTRHRVVVFVDDIDRLDKDEIKEVLRLIRNTANFPYIQFIVAYDKDYIISTLKDSGIESPTSYLAKFFNLEITLPKYENRIICSELEKRLSEDINKLGLKGLDKTIHNMINNSAVKDNKIHENLISRILINVRDVIRFRNSFYISIHTIIDLHNQNEIGIVDLFYLELLRYRYNDVYMILRNRPTSILKSENEDTFNYNSESLKNITSTSYNVYDQDIIKDIFDDLFHHNFRGPFLSHKRYFANYFMLRPDDKIFTEMDFMLLSGLSEPELSRQAEKMYNHKFQFEFKRQISEILENVYTINSYTSQSIKQIADYENIYGTLKSLLASRKLKNKALKNEIRSAIMTHLERLNFYDGKHLLSILELYYYLDFSNASFASFVFRFLSNLLSKSNLHIDSKSTSIDNYKTIIVSFLKNINNVAKISDAITNIIECVNNKKISADDLIINVPTLTKIKLDYFINYNNKLSDNGFVLFGNCIYYTDTDTDKVHLVKKTLEVMRTEIEEKPEFYLSNFIHKGSSADNKNALYPEQYCLVIFGSNDDFEKFLESHKSLPSYKRVFRYWQLYKFNEYTAVMFDKQANVDDVLANNFENEWEAFMQLKKNIQKYKYSPISLQDIKSAVHSVNSNIQWKYSLVEKLQREYNN